MSLNVVRCTDNECSLVIAYGGDLAEPRIRLDDFGDEVDYFLGFLKFGSVVSVEVDHRPRRHGVSKYGVFDRLWVGIVDLFGVMWLLRRTVLPDIEEEE